MAGAGPNAQTPEVGNKKLAAPRSVNYVELRKLRYQESAELKKTELEQNYSLLPPPSCCAYRFAHPHPHLTIQRRSSGVNMGQNVVRGLSAYPNALESRS